jgi:hypothetical protein
MKGLFVSAAAISITFCGPAAAGGLRGDAAPVTQRSAAFAGLSLSLPLGGGGAKPRAALGAGFVRSAGDASGRVERRISLSGLELPLAGAGRPDLAIGGRSLAELRPSLRGSGSTPFIVGGVLLAAGAVVLLTTGDSGQDDGPLNPCPPGVEVCAF